jgi:hypothetical protein
LLESLTTKNCLTLETEEEVREIQSIKRTQHDIAGMKIEGVI